MLRECLKKNNLKNNFQRDPSKCLHKFLLEINRITDALIQNIFPVNILENGTGQILLFQWLAYNWRINLPKLQIEIVHKIIPSLLAVRERSPFWVLRTLLYLPAETHSGHSQASKIDLFAIIVNYGSPEEPYLAAPCFFCRCFIIFSPLFFLHRFIFPSLFKWQQDKEPIIK